MTLDYIGEYLELFHKNQSDMYDIDGVVYQNI